jgi:aldose 1-epimerase
VGGVTLRSDLLEVTFRPAVGMVGTSLRHRGQEVLALPGGLEGYRAGDVTGLPLLAPWANRLGARRYEVGAVVVDLDGLDLYTDDQGLPIHGTMTAQEGWVVSVVDDRSLRSRFDFGARDDLLASFPFPHEIHMDVDVHGATLTVVTALVPTVGRAVPVAFGYHPYLRLPGVARHDVRLGLPARRRFVLDRRQLPTGATRPELPEDEPVGTRVLDDLFELGDDRQLSLTGGGRRLVLTLEEGYPYAQVFAPPGADFVCLEPMTAPVNVLVDGGYAVARPGGRYTARFSIRLEDA